VQVAIYNVAGRQVRLLHNGILSAGAHGLPWDGRSNGGGRVASGIYLVRVSTAVESSTQRLVLLR